MKMDKENTRKAALAVTGGTGLLLVGVLPTFVPTINLTTPILGALNLGVTLGLAQLGVFYAVWKKLL